jgi:uncharacterized protein (TIGR02588 family)
MAKERHTPNVLERVVAALGVLLTLAVVGVLVWDAVNDDGAGPRLRIELGRPAAADGAVHLPVRVHNDGGETAEDVTVEVCRGDGAAEECAETTFPFVPRGSERDGVVGFTAAAGPLRARVASYQRP